MGMALLSLKSIGSDAGGMSCGFSNFPTLGIGALQWSWNFDFQLIYVGAGASLRFSVPLPAVMLLRAY